MIEFVDIHKRFGDRDVLQGVNLRVEEGAVQFIIGSSGAGKSVLVKHLVGLIRPDSGRILLDGEEITHRSERDFYPIRKKCAMVFQHATLFDSMTLILGSRSLKFCGCFCNFVLKFLFKFLMN